MHNLPENNTELANSIRVSLFEDFAEDLDQFGIFEADRVEEIPCQSCDGFIPHTNGGFRAMVTTDLSYHYNAAKMH